MATSSQITTNFGIQNWIKQYQSFNNPVLGSSDFATLRKSFIDYLQSKNPENFNDYIQSSEYIALIDLIAFMGQGASFRFDLNARENFLSTAQTRNSINNLANLVNYKPTRNLAANGYLKINNISINENIYDSLGNNLNGIYINWNDKNNRNWLDQWNSVLNAILINSQTIGTPGNTNIINGINYSEYGMSTPTTQVPPYPFNATIDNNSMNFEIVNPTSINQSYIYEVDPENTGQFNILYENDGFGYNSQNTGYFLYFKQGTLSSQSFNIASPLPNTTISLGNTGINNDDIWLYQVNSDNSLTLWTQVDSIYGGNNIIKNLPSSEQTIYSITNNANDSITLVFGDGVFGVLPSGTFICFTRSSNGLTYRINPSEMSNITLSLPYNSKTNRTQLFSFRASLLYTVGNSAGTESLSNIKLKAPQSFYSQNRMVNGQDYNSFPFTQYSNLLQVKSINRTSSGVSRYLDVIDPTGKYSSTNIFGDDGFLYLDSSIITNNYTYSNLNNLSSIIESKITQIIANSSTYNFILNNYPSTQSSSTIIWNMVLTDNNSCSGWLFNNSTQALATLSDSAFGGLLNTAQGNILQFSAPNPSTNHPYGQAFDINNNLVDKTSSTLSLNQKEYIYASITGNPTNNGIGNEISMDGTNVDGSGAITLTQKVPSGAILNNILPFYSPILSQNIIQNMNSYINSGQAFAIEYYPNSIIGNTPYWTLDTTLPLNFNPTLYGNTFIIPISTPSNTVSNSWILAFVPNTSQKSFTVYQRQNTYYFGSEIQTSFYFDNGAKVYDPVNATTLTDTITILQTNSSPSNIANLGLSQDISIDVTGIVDQINGSIDTSRVIVDSSGIESTGIPMNPFFFNDCVGNNFIFLVTDNSQNTTKLISSGKNQVIVVPNPSFINNNLYSYANGTIIFSQSNAGFYKIYRNGVNASKTTLNNSGDTLTYSYFVGRQDLKFQYIHNAADSRRIDPSPANIVDMYCLEASYANAYQTYITDQTGQINEPTPPTSDTLSNDFSSLLNYKMISDEIIFNSAQFVPLFGNKADYNLQATFVVVTNPNISIGTGEIASQVITNINNFFTIGNFTFGQTFYWAQLSNFILTNMANIINAIHLVPSAGNLSYGNLEEITCNPWEIFISAATVSQVNVVSNLNNLNLRIN